MFPPRAPRTSHLVATFPIFSCTRGHEETPPDEVNRRYQSRASRSSVAGGASVSSVKTLRKRPQFSTIDAAGGAG